MKTQGMSCWLPFLVVLAVGLAGCHSWSTAGYPLQNPSRVPPIGTGTYQVPSSYYNHTGGSVSQIPQRMDPVAANQQATFNQYTDSGSNMTAHAVPSHAAVQPAGYTTSPVAVQESHPNTAGAASQVQFGAVESNAAAAPNGGSASASFNDADEIPNFQWRQ